MKGLDFWATDEWTDGGLPIFDEWSITFLLSEHMCEIMRDEVMLALGIIIPRLS